MHWGFSVFLGFRALGVLGCNVFWVLGFEALGL